VFSELDPVQWTGHQAVIALPEHIDVSNSGPISEERQIRDTAFPTRRPETHPAPRNDAG